MGADHLNGISTALGHRHFSDVGIGFAQITQNRASMRFVVDDERPHSMASGRHWVLAVKCKNCANAVFETIKEQTSDLTDLFHGLMHWQRFGLSVYRKHGTRACFASYAQA